MDKNVSLVLRQDELIARAALLPRFKNGAYSTNVVPLEKMADEDLPEKPEGTRIYDKIEKAIHGMFWRYSNVSDLTCTKHTNGLDNLRYGSAIPKLVSGYLKGNDEEVEQALVQMKWDGPRREFDTAVMGVVLNTKYKKKSN